MTSFGETIFKHKMLLEGLMNKYYGKSIPVSTAVEVASRAMNFQTAYDFESCLAVMQEAFDVNDGYFVDSASAVPVVRCAECKFRENDDFCIGRGFPYQLVPDDGFCDKGERKE